MGTAVNEQVRPVFIEPRWPVMLSILAVLAVLTLLSARIRFFPSWLPYLIVIVSLVPVAGVWLSSGGAAWLRMERVTLLVYSTLVEAMNIVTLLYLIINMLGQADNFSARQLLASGVGAWVANVLAFSLVYWMTDRGGPETRANNGALRPEWLFPQAGVPDKAPPGWRPEYADYLFLSFSTAMAFSATDTAPLTTRSKMLMMIESAVSLMTLVIVAARAINILG